MHMTHTYMLACTPLVLYLVCVQHVLQRVFGWVGLVALVPHSLTVFLLPSFLG